MNGYLFINSVSPYPLNLSDYKPGFVIFETYIKNRLCVLCGLKTDASYVGRKAGQTINEKTRNHGLGGETATIAHLLKNEIIIPNTRKNLNFSLPCLNFGQIL